MKALQLYLTEPIDDIVWPKDDSSIALNSPALTIFTDFKIIKPLTLNADTPAIEAEKSMRQFHVRLKIIVDQDHHLKGIVSLDNLHEQEFMKRIDTNIKREDLLVQDFMIPKSQLMAFDYAELKKATIGDVLETLKSNRQQHCLVLERNAHQIRGVISASDIARKLKLLIDITNEANFAHIFHTVHV